MCAAHKKAGFTLIETVVYIGLSGLVIASLIAAAYPMFTSTDKIVSNVTADTEAIFIFRKIENVLSSVASAAPIATPPPGGQGSQLRVNTLHDGAVTIDQNGSDIRINSVPLNASRIVISNFLVTHFAPAGGLPRYVEISFDGNGRSYGPVRHYLHF